MVLLSVKGVSEGEGETVLAAVARGVVSTVSIPMFCSSSRVARHPLVVAS
jgi:hypothetical protein